MASFLNTDISDLVSQWQHNAAINEQTALFEEAYERARVNSIRSAGAEAFKSGLSLDDAKAGYRENLELQAAEKQYPRGDVSESGALDFMDDLGAVDDLGKVDDVSGPWETVRDDDGNFVEVINHGAHYVDDGTVWDDEKGDFVRPDFIGDHGQPLYLDDDGDLYAFRELSNGETVADYSDLANEPFGRI